MPPARIGELRMEVSEKEDLVTRVHEASREAAKASVALRDAAFLVAADIIKDAQSLAVVAAKTAGALAKLSTTLQVIEADLAELEETE